MEKIFPQLQGSGNGWSLHSYLGTKHFEALLLKTLDHSPGQRAGRREIFNGFKASHNYACINLQYMGLFPPSAYIIIRAMEIKNSTLYNSMTDTPILSA